MGRYEFFDHTADIGMRVWADSFEDLLAAAGRGLTELIVAKPETVKPVERRTVELQNSDRTLLLFDLLSEMVYFFEVEQLLFSEITVQSIGADSIKAALAGEPFDPGRHPEGHELKAVTYHGLSVEEKDCQWRAEVIFDI